MEGSETSPDTPVETQVQSAEPAAAEEEAFGYEVSEEPTAARPRDENGRELDHWGLPRNGPARIDALCQIGKRDPLKHPEDWSDEAAETAKPARRAKK